LGAFPVPGARTVLCPTGVVTSVRAPDATARGSAQPAAIARTGASIATWASLTRSPSELIRRTAS